MCEKEIECCRGCFACQKTGLCVLRDDMAEILVKMRQADVIVIATPVYFYGMCGAMKTFLDRTFPLYPDKQHFQETYLLAAAGEDLKSTVQGTQAGLEGWISCFENIRLSEVIFAGGVMEKGEIEGHPALCRAYEAGKNV